MSEKTILDLKRELEDAELSMQIWAQTSALSRDAPIERRIEADITAQRVQYRYGEALRAYQAAIAAHGYNTGLAALSQK